MTAPTEEAWSRWRWPGRLQAVLEITGMSTRQAARSAKAHGHRLSHTQIGYVARGQRPDPGTHLQISIAAGLAVEPSTLFPRSEAEATASTAIIMALDRQRSMQLINRTNQRGVSHAS